MRGPRDTTFTASGEPPRKSEAAATRPYEPKRKPRKLPSGQAGSPSAPHAALGVGRIVAAVLGSGATTTVGATIFVNGSAGSPGGGAGSTTGGDAGSTCDGDSGGGTTCSAQLC